MPLEELLIKLVVQLISEIVTVLANNIFELK